MLIARFRVTGFEPRQVEGLSADWFGMLTFAKTFTEGIDGEATTLFVSSGPEGSRGYVATERISGRLTGADAEGTLVVQHGGLESDADAAFGWIVPGTGTGPFAGWTGAARIRHDEQGAYFEFTDR